MAVDRGKDGLARTTRTIACSTLRPVDTHSSGAGTGVGEMLPLVVAIRIRDARKSNPRRPTVKIPTCGFD